MTCHGCNQPLEPLAQIRTYHSGCDPQGRMEYLERALSKILELSREAKSDVDAVLLVSAGRLLAEIAETCGSALKGKRGG